jgi:small-conductance mechanosensitive channel
VEDKTMTLFGSLPPWILQATSSLVAVVSGYVVGHFLKWFVRRRLTALATRTRGQWDDVVVTELARRVPFWGLLLGVYIAIGFWTLPPNLQKTLERILFALVTASVTLFAAAIAGKLIVAYGSTLERALPITSLTQNIATGIVIAIGLLIVLNGLGVSITPILTALGVGGLAVALALQDTLANFFAGIYITLAGQIRVGDYVRLDSGQEGYVSDIGWRSTRIRMLPNNLVLVPNAKLAQAIVINYYLPDKELAVLVEVGVDYGSDLGHVERVTCEVAKDTLKTVQGGAADFDPFIRYHTFADSSVNFTVILRAREYVDQYLLKHEFIKRLHRRYGQEAITIPFPIRTIVQQQRPGGREGPPPP